MTQYKSFYEKAQIETMLGGNIVKLKIYGQTLSGKNYLAFIVERPSKIYMGMVHLEPYNDCSPKTDYKPIYHRYIPLKTTDLNIAKYRLGKELPTIDQIPYRDPERKRRKRFKRVNRDTLRQIK